MNDDSRPVLERTAEANDLDFKSGFHNNLGEWLEIIKDIVAFANSGGGTILFGVNDDGTPSREDVTRILDTDPADITNKIHKYTGTQFHAFEIASAAKGGHLVGVLSVRAARIPIVFISIGNYEPTPGARPKTAFNVGTVYFRHGAKSEPGNSEDLRAFLEREVDSIKESWLSGIAKVVEAPAGSRVAILPPSDEPTVPSEVVRVQLTDDPKALQILAMRLDQTFPHRQKEVVTAVNQKLEGSGKITTHDAQCINRVYKVKENIKFCHTQKHASPQYSEQLVDWIVKMFEDDSEFFAKTKESAKLQG
jgi:hypothetical protein